MTFPRKSIKSMYEENVNIWRFLFHDAGIKKERGINRVETIQECVFIYQTTQRRIRPTTSAALCSVSKLYLNGLSVAVPPGRKLCDLVFPVKTESHGLWNVLVSVWPAVLGPKKSRQMIRIGSTVFFFFPGVNSTCWFTSGDVQRAGNPAFTKGNLRAALLTAV